MLFSIGDVLFVVGIALLAGSASVRLGEGCISLTERGRYEHP